MAGFGIPVYLGIKLYKGHQNNKLESHFFQKRYGILYLEYKPKYYFWEIILLVNVNYIINNMIIRKEKRNF